VTKKLNIVEELDAGKGPMTYPGGPNHIDCRKQAKVPFSRLDITCWFMEKERRCQCALDVAIPDIADECIRGNCPVSFPGGPLPSDCKRQGKASNNDEINCKIIGDFCHCNKIEIIPETQPIIETTQKPIIKTDPELVPHVAEVCDAGNCPVTFTGTSKMKARGCRILGSVPKSRKDIICTISNSICTCDCPTCNIPIPEIITITEPNEIVPNVPKVCDAGECPVNFTGTAKMKSKGCRILGSVPKTRSDIICSIQNSICTCDCPTCGVSFPNVPEELDAGRGPVQFQGGPKAKACRIQGQVPKSRKDIRCTARNGQCICTCASC